MAEEQFQPNPAPWAQAGNTPPAGEPTPPANGRRRRGRPAQNGEKKPRQRRTPAAAPVAAPQTSFKGELEMVVHIAGMLRGVPSEVRTRIIDAIIKLT